MPPRRRLRYPVLEGETPTEQRDRLTRESRQRRHSEQQQQNKQPTNNNRVSVGTERKPPTMTPGIG